MTLLSESGGTHLPAHPSAQRLRTLPDRAIVAHDLTKTFRTDGLVIEAVQGVSFRLNEGERMGILGANGAGKSTLINLLGGVTAPTSGQIYRGMSISWPLGLGGGFFEGHLTGYDNVRFLSRLYERPFDELYAFVMEFSELSTLQIRTPVRFFSSGMKMRLAFALSIAIDFDCTLIDEVIMVGDRRFQAKCLEAVFNSRPDRAIIMAVHDSGIVKAYCSRVMIMKNGRSRVFDDVDYASRIYATL